MVTDTEAELVALPLAEPPTAKTRETCTYPVGIVKKSYIGETGRGMDKRLKEHRRDVRNDMEHSAFVLHAHSTNHLPNWGGAKVIAKCKSKGSRKATEAAYIATNETINTRVGFIKWAKSAAVYCTQMIK